MNISNSVNQDKPVNNRVNQPSFRAGMSNLLNLSGNTMQWIENQGFLASFLIQDFGGMTVPRTAAGFLRDKENTGHYNMQEGFEVFGREVLTGPSMMAVAPLAMLIAAKFGRSTSVNTALIKRFGNSLRELVSKPEFDKKLLENPEKFKQVFYKSNIEKMLNDTIGKENTTKESIDYILKQVNNFENTNIKGRRARNKYKKNCMDNIVAHINNLKYSSSDELDILQKVKFGSDKLDSKKVFSTKDAIDGMIKYSNDAITANKHLKALDEIQAESIKNKSLAKRLITNISTMAATLGVLSVLPKIYARSNTAPGARKVEDQKTRDYNIAFEGKQPNKNLLEKIGKQIGKNDSDFVSSELEYNGHNFTNTLMAGLSIFGLLAPRGLRAYNRAQVNEDGKKDLTELWEIFIRDVTSSLAVVFAVPMGTRAFVTLYEKNTGFVLMNKDRTRSSFKTIIDLLNPYSKAHVLTNSEITALYNKVNTREKMLNFCKYIDKNGGDLQKILSKSENSSEIFNKSTFELASLKGLKKADKNKKLINFFEKFNKSNANELISRMMQGTLKNKSKITSFARGLNSIPGLITTFFISPYILGWFIPRLTYKNTRRIHEKEDKERALKQQQTETKIKT